MFSRGLDNGQGKAYSRKSWLR